MDLLITHTDLDGISPIILMNLVGRKFEYHTLDINEIPEFFDKLLESDLNKYENIYITDLTIPEKYYELLKNLNINIRVFDHHETHLYANNYSFAQVEVNHNNRQTCGTELFYLYLKELYPIIDKSNIAQYVDLVRELDTYTFTTDMPKELSELLELYGKADFIKSIVKRLKKNKEIFEFTAFEKRLSKIRKNEIKRYMQRKESQMFVYEIKGRVCGVIFAENHKSELGHYISSKYPKLDLVILIDAASRISYRTERKDISVSEFASIFNGGGHRQASGSAFNDENRAKVIEEYFDGAKRLLDFEIQ